MHNLFLGSTKRFMEKAWRNDNNRLINNNQLQLIDQIIQAAPPPADIGRILYKILVDFQV